ncbi:uncharacterized protein LOC107274007 [Cephus cinctus]|uniref:Uncharacterized protein LOC107274007 n=1 Tax=Cephus cinctus TaxID=211228 RepID=A0AAJ7CE05_CEPCN|nr:uncharacterized protein LOC107274007 [Cephus cinctus]
MTLRRFIARRGRPSVGYSDNGLNFSGLNNELKRIDYKILASLAATEQIEWKFNPPAAAWWGGFWERLIGVLKKLLRRTLKKSCLNYEEMSTVLIDCEGIINSRPITFVSESENEIMPLATSNFLQEIKEIGVLDLDNVERSPLNKRYAYRQTLEEELRHRFRSEYLGALINQRSKVDYPVEIKVGDIVLIGYDNVKRLHWPLARVTEKITGKDGVVRVVRLKTATGELFRPVQRVFPLELNYNNTDLNVKESTVIKNSEIAKKSYKKQRPQENVDVIKNKEPHVTRYAWLHPT